jgi:transcriptional regulator with XRE-family HTH domain
MRVHRWKDLKDAKLTPAQRKANQRCVEAQLLEMNLKALRESLGKTQEELAKLAEVAQSELSRTERREDHLVSTLRRYVEALGGELEIVASFGDKRVRLQGV